MNLKTSAQLLLNGQFKIIEFDQGGIPALDALKNVAINNTLWNLIPSINENNCKRELDYCLKIQKPVSFEVYLPEFSSLFCFFFYPFKDGLGCVINNLSAAVTSDDKREELMNELVQRNRDLEQFTYIVSHNLNAPLATLIGFTELLKSNLNERDRSFILTSLEDSVHKMDSLVKDINEILNLKKVIIKNKTKLDLNEIMQSTLDSMSERIQQSGAVIKYDFSEVSEITSVRPYIQSLFVNLVTNAVKYARLGVKPEILVTSKKQGDNVIITFKDNGTGIDLEKYGEQLFGLYKRFNLSVEGKGMGLYMVKTQINALGGKVEVESKLDIGSSFKVTLPL